MIQQHIIDNIVETARIEDVIGEFVNLKRAGANLKALSPFSNEKTPSFVVSPAKQIFKCFSTDLAGNVVTFIMEHERMSFVESIKWLAEKYNIEIPEGEQTEEQIEQRKHEDSLYLVNDFANMFYKYQLRESDEGKNIGLNYFKERGYNQSTIDLFELGYSKQESTLYHSAHKRKYNTNTLFELGLVNNIGKDFFRGRIVFPIHSMAGKILGFGGRTMNGDKAKYINSIESKIYSKSNTLYGLHQSKKNIRIKDECILVEGYTDVISLFQNGIDNVVASSGTALTNGQIRLIKRHTNNVVILYDGDKAGIKAALKGLNLMLENDMNVKLCILPNGQDPDGYIKENGYDKTVKFINDNAKDFLLFKIDYLLKDVNDPIAKAEVTKDIISSISCIGDPVKRSIYVNEASKLLKIDEKTILEQIGVESEQVTPEQPKQIDVKPKIKANAKELGLLRVIMLFGDKIHDNGLKIAHYCVSECLDWFEYVDLQEVFSIIYEEVESGHCPSFDWYLKHSNEFVRDLSSSFIDMSIEYSENWENKLNYPLQTQKKVSENYSKDSDSVINNFKLDKTIYIQKVNQDRIRTSRKLEDQLKYLKIQLELNKVKEEITKKIGREGVLFV